MLLKAIVVLIEGKIMSTSEPSKIQTIYHSSKEDTWTGAGTAGSGTG